MNLDLALTYEEVIREILKKHIPNAEIWAFGSRARWTAKDTSDLDLAIISDEKTPSKILTLLKMELEDSDIPFKVDILDWQGISEEFQTIIKEEYVVFQRKKADFKTKIVESQPLGETSLILEDGDRGKEYPKQEDFLSNGYCLFLSAKNVTSKGFDFSECQFITSEKDEILRKGKPRRKDIILTTRGTVGNVAYFGDHVPFKNLRINFGIVIIKGSEEWDSEFLYYLFTSDNLKKQIKSLRSGTAQPQLPIKDIKRLKLPVFKVKEQKKIVKVLNSLHYTIRNNEFINVHLEKIAQIIFKSWFVDFDPIHAKKIALEKGLSKEQAERATMAIISGICSPSDFAANFKEMDQRLTQKLSKMGKAQQEELAYTASLFPSEFEDSDFGEIPKGWSISTIGDNIKILDSKRIPLSKQQREKISGNIPYYGATSCMGYVNDYIFNEELVLMGEDGSVVDKDGFPFIQYIWGKSWVNNHAHVLKGIEYFNSPHLYFLLKQTNITAFVTGAVQLKINQGNLKSIKFVKGTGHLSSVYNELTNSFMKKIMSNSDENKKLEKLRDTLLPKLLAGEIDLSNIKLDENVESA